MSAVAIAPSLNIVTGSTSCAGTETPRRSVPPRLIAPPDGVDVLLSDADVPHAARIAPIADAEMPSTLPRTSSCCRVMRPVRASSYRWYSSSSTTPPRRCRRRPSSGSEAGTLPPIDCGIKDLDTLPARVAGLRYRAPDARLRGSCRRLVRRGVVRRRPERKPREPCGGEARLTDGGRRRVGVCRAERWARPGDGLP